MRTTGIQIVRVVTLSLFVAAFAWTNCQAGVSPSAATIATANQALAKDGPILPPLPWESLTAKDGPILPPLPWES